MPKILNNVREDILKIARDTLINSQYSKISVREIALKCGVATGTLYNYFKSKQEIIVCILNSDLDTMTRRMENSNKIDKESIEKLEFIFVELSFFMNHIHNIWYKNYIEEFDINQLYQMKEKKKLLNIQLQDLISDALNNNISYIKDKILCELLAGLFLFFANEPTVNFEKFKPYILKLLN